MNESEGEEAEAIALGTVAKDSLSGRIGVLERYEDDDRTAVLRTGGGEEFTASAARLIILGSGAKRQTS